MNVFKKTQRPEPMFENVYSFWIFLSSSFIPQVTYAQSEEV